MNTYRLNAVREGEFLEVPDPEPPGWGQVTIRIVRVGVCGSDLHYYRTGRIGDQIIDFPFTVGHECSGEIVALGEGVTDLSPGDRVAIDPSVSCGKCDQCRSGREHTCRHNQFLGCPGQLSGALATYVTLPASCCFPMAPGMTWEQAVMSEPLAIAVYATSKFIDPADCTVAVLGSGPIGLCIVECASHYGARSLFATDPLPYRQAAASRHKATWAGRPDELNGAIAISEPDGVDVVFECCGSQEAVDQAFEILRPGGTLLMVGIPEFDRLEIPIHLARRKEVRIQNVRRQVGCVEEALRLIAEGHVNVAGMITHHFALRDSETAFRIVDAYADEVIKAMIEVSDS